MSVFTLSLWENFQWGLIYFEQFMSMVSAFAYIYVDLELSLKIVIALFSLQFQLSICLFLRNALTQYLIKVGKVSTNFAAAKNGKVGSNFLQQKTVKLAAAVKNGKVSSSSKKR